MDSLYKNIREKREALGMSQDTLAAAVGYTSRSSIAKIEAGEVDIPRSKIIAFAKALHCTPAELTGWDHETAIDDDTSAVLQTLKDRPEMKILFSASEKATSDDIIRAAKFLEAMTDTDRE